MKAIFILVLVGLTQTACGPSHDSDSSSQDSSEFRTTNFVVKASTPEFAADIGKAAEEYRKSLTQRWLGKTFPNWAKPIPITVNEHPEMAIENLSIEGKSPKPLGETWFTFRNGEVFGWNMVINAAHDDVISDILPHEITHTIMATEFRTYLPKWADEGLCDNGRKKQDVRRKKQLVYFLKNERGLAFSDMLVMQSYPDDILPLYSEGYTLVLFLVSQSGEEVFIKFLAEAMAGNTADTNLWQEKFTKYYHYATLQDLQTSWLEWVKLDMPDQIPEQLKGHA